MLINELNDDCLIAVLKQLPLAELIDARKVCHQWASLVPKAIKSIESLSILVGNHDKGTLYNWIHCGNIREQAIALLKKEDGTPLYPVPSINNSSCLLYRQLDEYTVKQISSTFPNINTLAIGLFDCGKQPLEYITHLLKLWRHKLVTLHLKENLRPEWSNEQFNGEQLFEAINSLEQLKHLRLQLLRLEPCHLPICSQLETISVDLHGFFPINEAKSRSLIVSSLQQYASTNTALRSIEYNCPDYITCDEFSISNLNDSLRSSFTRLDTSGTDIYCDAEVIRDRFANLTRLSFDLPFHINRYRLFGPLSQLTRLVYLRLSLGYFSIIEPWQQHDELPQLSSVRVLQVNVGGMATHERAELFKVSWTMPNIEVLAVKVNYSAFMCKRCNGLCFSQLDKPFDMATIRLFRHCHTRMLTLLTDKCTKLRTVVHNFEMFPDSTKRASSYPQTPLCLKPYDIFHLSENNENYWREEVEEAMPIRRIRPFGRILTHGNLIGDDGHLAYTLLKWRGLGPDKRN